jgi:lipopolysaccharide/colanic/teichoic acid biosynthesis glycosyltransferase
MTVGSDKNAPDWTRINDPRVTRFVRFLRKSHLDEIPQFLNVLLGDMSIVGPRPEQAHLVAKFASLIPFYSRRFIVRPGITGWWQVNYEPYVESLEELKNRLKDDFYYIENMSIRLDIEIVLRTIYLVFKGHGQA